MNNMHNAYCILHMVKNMWFSYHSLYFLHYKQFSVFTLNNYRWKGAACPSFLNLHSDSLSDMYF